MKYYIIIKNSDNKYGGGYNWSIVTDVKNSNLFSWAYFGRYDSSSSIVTYLQFRTLFGAHSVWLYSQHERFVFPTVLFLSTDFLVV